MAENNIAKWRTKREKLFLMLFQHEFHDTAEYRDQIALYNETYEAEETAAAEVSNEALTERLFQIVEKLGTIDAELNAAISGWKLNRIGKVDITILRLAAYEMFHRKDVPDNVAISEALNLSNQYSEPKSTRYINGVLGAMEREKNEDK